MSSVVHHLGMWKTVIHLRQEKNCQISWNCGEERLGKGRNQNWTTTGKKRELSFREK